MNEAGIDVTWDASKAQSNIAKHGVTFAQAATVLLDPLAITVFDEAHSQAEERWFTLGMSGKANYWRSRTHIRLLNLDTREYASSRRGKQREANEYNIKADQSDR